MMKTKKILILFSFLFINLGITYSQSASIPSDVITGFEQGKADLIANHMNSDVEIIIGSTNNVYSKQQAEGVLRDFFSKNKVVSFSVIHKGDKGTSTFLIGKLKTESGTFRIHLLGRKSGSEINIQQIRIDEN